MEEEAGKVCGCVSKSVGCNWFNFLCSSASVFAVIWEGRFLPPPTHLVKSADTVSLIRLSAIINVVHSIYIRKFFLKEQYKIQSLVPVGFMLGSWRSRDKEVNEERKKKHGKRQRDIRKSQWETEKGERKCQWKRGDRERNRNTQRRQRHTKREREGESQSQT